MKTMMTVLITLGLVMTAMAELHHETVEYKQGGTDLEGYLVWDDAQVGSRPGILVCHEWWGLNDYIKSRADQLAKLGYIAFACDLYGKGKRATTMDEAKNLSGEFYQNRDLLRERVTAGYNVLRRHPLADTTHIAAIGYCFGGMAALDLARSGADVAGVVTFHGSLANPTPENAKNVKAKILVLAGADDPYVNAEQVAAFEKEMTDAGVDWEVVKYSGTVHAFTNPNSGNDPSKGVAYNAESDHRSWQAMKDFFGEIFK